MVPLTDIIRTLAADMFGLKVADAGAVFGTTEDIVTLCTAAGFKEVQVTFYLCVSILDNCTVLPRRFMTDMR